jgi:hypothetical protein
VPAVRLVAGGHVFALGDAGVVFDRDLVVVPDEDQVAQLLVTGERAHLVADALLDVPVGADRVDEVVERALAGRGVGVVQAALAAGGHRHADRVAQALAERAGGGLHADRVAVLGVTRRQGAPLPQRLQIVQRQAVAGQVELDVQGQAGVAGRQHEPVTTDPGGVGGVVPQNPVEQQVRGGCQAHRGAGVAVSGLLHGVHREDPDRVGRATVEIRPGQLAGSGQVGGHTYFSGHGARCSSITI